MKLTCFVLNDTPPKLVAAGPHRDWMDAFPDKHAYRCLPLSIANAHGWEVLMPIPVEIEWNGGPNAADLTIRGLKPLSGGRPLDHFVRSNFTRGIVTFHTDYLFRTEPGWDLICTGPVNRPKDNAYALTGLIEADWLPYPFTMNWQIQRPGTVRFEEDEPFCFIYPVPKQALTDIQPEIRRLSDDPELMRQHIAFRDSRDEFLTRLRAGDEAAIRQAWQRHYFVGRHPDGTTIDTHLNKLRLHEPVDRRTPRPASPLPAPAKPAEPKRQDPRWDDASLLNAILPGQTARNHAGRARIDSEGKLTPSPNTRRISAAGDAAGLDFLYIEDFLSVSECALLCRAFEGLQDRLFAGARLDPYWSGRFIWLNDVLASHPEAGDLMIARQRAGIQAVGAFYRLRVPIYSDLLQIVQWKQGMFMRPHADNAHPDGSAHGMAYRDLSSVIYLNDDYEGGEFYFTALDIAIKPKRGSFLALTAGFHHEHGVLHVGGGSTRLTIPSFYTFDPARADPLLHPEAATK